MAPYLLLGFLAAGALSAMVSPEKVERHLGGRGLWPVVKAAILGVPLPLCSCGVLPVAASLRKHGASRGATTSFLLSTPQTGVDSILVTWSLLGPVFAIFRPLAAFATGLAGGCLVDALDGPTAGTAVASPACEEECCAPGPRRNRLLAALHYGFVVLPRDLARPMLGGLLVAGAIAAAVPEDFFAASLGRGIAGIAALMAIGIPLYVCATASVPIAAALMLKGVSPGAALAFLIAGPATNASAIATVWKMMGRRATAIYLATVAAAAVGSGLLMDALMDAPGAVAAHMHHHAGSSWVGRIAAVGLLALLGAGALRLGARRRAPAPAGGDGATVTLSIAGMHCEQCAASVNRALRGCEGVASVSVDARRGQATVTGQGYSTEALRAAVESLGYRVPSR